MRQGPAFSFYPNDFVMGTLTLSLAERGAYILLLCYQWDHGSVPDDPLARATALGCPRRTAEALWRSLQEKFFQGGDGAWRNARLEAERLRQVERRTALAKNGAKGGRPREPDGSPDKNQIETKRFSSGKPDGNQNKSLPSSSSGDLLPTNQGEDLSRAREETAENPKKNAERAGAFCVWYAEVHARLLHVGYIGNPRKDYEVALQLVATFSDQDLHDATFVWFGQEDAFAVTGTRTIPKFASRASALVQAAREVMR